VYFSTNLVLSSLCAISIMANGVYLSESYSMINCVSVLCAFLTFWLLFPLGAAAGNGCDGSEVTYSESPSHDKNHDLQQGKAGGGRD
jgi:hypothetical protein